MQKVETCCVHLLPVKCRSISVDPSCSAEICIQGGLLCEKLIEVFDRYCEKPCIVTQLANKALSSQDYECSVESVFLELANESFLAVDSMPTLSFCSKKEWFVDSLEILKGCLYKINSMLERKAQWNLNNHMEALVYKGFSLYKEFVDTYIKIIELSIDMKDQGLFFAWHEQEKASKR